MEKLDVKVGDTVIFRDEYGSSITKVAKITPTGIIRVEANKYLQFNPNGRERGGDTWNQHTISIPTDEEIKAIKDRAIIKTVVNYMHKVNDITIDQAKAIWNILHSKGEE